MAIIKNPLTVVQEEVQETKYNSSVKISNTIINGIFRPNGNSYPICNINGTQPSLTYRGDTSFEYKFRLKAVGEIANVSYIVNILTAGTSGDFDIQKKSPVFGLTKTGWIFLTFSSDGTDCQEAALTDEDHLFTSHYNEWFDVKVKYIPNTSDNTSKFQTEIKYENETVSKEYDFNFLMCNYSAVSQMVCGYWKFNGNLFIDTEQSYIKINDIVVWGN